MKKIKLLPLLSLWLLLAANVFGQATWNGSVSSDYNNPSNWTWATGSGVPNSSTDITVPHTAPNPIILTGSTSVACKNITITNLVDSMGEGVMPYFVYVKDSATFTIHGDISNGMPPGSEPSAGIINLDLDADFEPTVIYPKAKVALGQTLDQNISGVFLYMGKIEVGNYNATVNSAVLLLKDSLIFNGVPVANGLSVGGNIILGENGQINLSAKKIKLPAFTNTQTPPHIVTTNTTEYPGTGSRIANMSIDIIDGMIDYAIDSGLQVFPVGVSTKSFNPVSVTTSAANLLNIGTYGPLATSCAGTSFNDSSVKINYYISEMNLLGEDVVIASPVSLTYNVNPGLDILGSNYNPTMFGTDEVTNVFNISDPFGGCYSLYGNDTISASGNYRTVAQTTSNTEQVFLISSATTTPVIPLDSIVITPWDGTLLTDPTFAYGFSADLYPWSVSSDVTWEIIPVTGAATVVPSGGYAAVTGTANGTVWLKATAVSYPGQADSVLLTINFPPPVTSITVTTLTGAPAAITIPSGTLPLLATVLPADASSAVTWSIVSGASLATITGTGIVTAIANGTVVVRATSISTPSVYGEITITITNQVITPTSIVVGTIGAVPAEISVPSGTLGLTATVLPTGASPDVNWTISAGSTMASISATGVVTALANGTVTARATSMSTPSVYGEINITITNQPTSINNGQQQDALKVYPNPATDKVSISYAQSHPSLTINVYDVQGRIVHTQAVEANQLNGVVDIPTKQLTPGAYIINLDGVGVQLRKQIIKK